MSVATPKSQAKEPIQLDIILACRKQGPGSIRPPVPLQKAIECAHAKMIRLTDQGFALSRNDRKIVLFGQLLTSLSAPSDLASFADNVAVELDCPIERSAARRDEVRQRFLFEAP